MNNDTTETVELNGRIRINPKIPLISLGRTRKYTTLKGLYPLLNPLVSGEGNFHDIGEQVQNAQDHSCLQNKHFQTYQ